MSKYAHRLGRWPNRCPSRATAPEGTIRCDLRKGHTNEHATDRAMHWIVWSERTWTEAP